MNEVFVFLTDGFEEIEALATVDLLRRANVEVKMISITNSLTVTASHGVKVLADQMFSEANYDNGRMLILPGGTTAINDFEPLRELAKKYVAENKYVAAICAAPIVLGTLGLLDKKQYICYPGFEESMQGGIKSDKSVVVDGRIITAKGPAFSVDFALTLIEILQGKAVADKVKKAIFAEA